MSAAEENSKEAEYAKFKKYLENEGIIGALKETLLSLYQEPDKPKDALEYLENNFAEDGALKTELGTVKTENSHLKEKVAALEKEKGLLVEKLSMAKAKLMEMVDPNGRVIRMFDAALGNIGNSCPCSECTHGQCCVFVCYNTRSRSYFPATLQNQAKPQHCPWGTFRAGVTFADIL